MRSWVGLINAVWRYIVRPIAVGGMMAGAAYTLFRMRKGLFDGLKRAVSDLGSRRQAGRNHPHRAVHESENRLRLIAVMFACMIALYIYLSHQVLGGIVAAAGDADHRVFLRHGIGLSGGHHRFHQQSDLRA